MTSINSRQVYHRLSLRLAEISKRFALWSSSSFVVNSRITNGYQQLPVSTNQPANALERFQLTNRRCRVRSEMLPSHPSRVASRHVSSIGPPVNSYTRFFSFPHLNERRCISQPRLSSRLHSPINHTSHHRADRLSERF